MEKPIYTIDGAHFANFEEFVAEINNTLLVGSYWRGGLDAFDDMLWGGYGTPDEDVDFKVIWKNFQKSKISLGYEATAKWLNSIVDRAHPTNVPSIRVRIDQANNKSGMQLWMMIVDILTGHKNIELILEP